MDGNQDFLGRIVEAISVKHPLTYKKLAKNLKRVGPDHGELANEFFAKYATYLASRELMYAGFLRVSS